MEEKKKCTKDLVVFLDTVGRTIIGERKGETEDYVSVSNPAVVNIVPQQVQDPNTGQVVQRMALQLFPLFFREFLADVDAEVVFDYNKSNITLPKEKIDLDFKVGIQYDQLFTNVPAAQPEVASQPPVGGQPQLSLLPKKDSGTPKIDLFDVDEDK